MQKERKKDYKYFLGNSAPMKSQNLTPVPELKLTSPLTIIE